MFHVERTPGTAWMRRCQTGRPSRMLPVGRDQVDLTGQRKRVNESWVEWARFRSTRTQAVLS